jgi:rare lipoprotein A
MRIKMKDARIRGHFFFLVFFAVFLSACAETEFLIHTSKRVGSSTEQDQSQRYKVGDPYKIDSVWYYPAVNYEYKETGIASWYGAKFHGRLTANGSTYDMNALTAAHRTLPMPSIVRVTNLVNGRSLILKVNDRGPFARNRIIDISRRGAQLLGFQKAGTARVRVQILADKSRVLVNRIQGSTNLAKVSTPITVDRLPKPDVKTEVLGLPPGGQGAIGQVQSPTEIPASKLLTNSSVENLNKLSSNNLNIVSIKPVLKTKLFVQAGAYSRFDNANKARARLSSTGLAKVSSVLIKGRDLYRVRVGPIDDVKEADEILNAVIIHGYPTARIIVE